MRSSKFRIVSVGLVSEPAKKENRNEILVYPIELLPELNGELTPNSATVVSDGVDSLDIPYSASVKVGNYIKARWLSMSTNRVTPPDVKRGEQVLLWAFADEDKYYWTSLGRDDNLRRLENVVYAYSDISDPESNEALTIDNCYTVMVSTKDKHVSVKTVKVDGEPFEYLLQLNTKDGILIVRDEVGNYITMYSDKETIEVGNRSKSKVTLAKKNIKLKAPRDIDLNADNDLIFTAGRNVSLKAGGSISVDSGGGATFNIGGAYSLSASDSVSISASTTASIDGGLSASLSATAVSVSGASVSISGGGLRGESGGSQFTGTVNFRDVVTFNGTANFTSIVSFTGDATFTNDVTFNSGATFGGEVRGTNFYGNFYGTLYGNVVP